MLSRYRKERALLYVRVSWNQENGARPAFVLEDSALTVKNSD